MVSVSIIVLGWNNVQDTVECLESLERSDHLDSNVILVDNGSIDDTVATVRKQFPHVQIIENKANLGFAEGNNVGIRCALARGDDYVFLLNNDARIMPDTISQLVRGGQQNPDIGILSPAVISFHERSKIYVGSRIFWENAGVIDIEMDAVPHVEILDSDYASGCALLIKSNVIREIGLLTPDYFAYFEDVDWSVRCRKAGYRVVVVPQAKVYHKGSIDQSDHKSATALFLFRRNQFLFLRKHGKWSHWFSFLKYSTRKSLEQYQSFRQIGDQDKADALIAGWWAGITGHYGAPRAESPRWLENLVHRRLGILLWLTGWLYFWDYQKVKRAKSKAQRVVA